MDRRTEEQKNRRKKRERQKKRTSMEAAVKQEKGWIYKVQGQAQRWR